MKKSLLLVHILSMVIDGNFDGHIKWIPLRDTLGGQLSKLYYVTNVQRCPILGLKLGPKWYKMVQNGPNCHFAAEF